MKSQKITRLDQAASKRRYDDACGTAHALDLIGERWALLVMRELMLGPKRFSDLRSDLPGISANVLTQRLEGLEAAGLVVRRRLPPPASAQVYELTPWGYEAEPIVQSLGKWAARSPAHDPTLPISATSIMLSFRTMFDAGRAGDFRARIGFRLGSESFVAQVEEGRFESGRGETHGADVVFTGTAPGLAAFVYGGQPPDVLEAAGLLKMEGDYDVARRFASLFPLPPKVGAGPQTP
ncbi:MAG TPA: winged helix-turn-helix transcriptional regulator [Allosphingosinicella sp.]|nr:winged helix-turn-helix transcriptional regulator [Allosphingosinicella sp.]